MAVVFPALRSMEVRKAQTDPLPLVPATWTTLSSANSASSIRSIVRRADISCLTFENRGIRFRYSSAAAIFSILCEFIVKSPVRVIIHPRGIPSQSLSSDVRKHLFYLLMPHPPAVLRGDRSPVDSRSSQLPFFRCRRHDKVVHQPQKNRHRRRDKNHGEDGSASHKTAHLTDGGNRRQVA